MEATIGLDKLPKKHWHHVLKGLVASNIAFLRDNPQTPNLYNSGVRYRREKGTENWDIVPVVLERGFGDCEDLATWRAAELRLKGVKAQPWIVKTGENRFHAVVKLPTGQIEDPSKILIKKYREKVGSVMSSKHTIQYRVKKTPNGYVARIKIPRTNNLPDIDVKGTAKTEIGALGAAADAGLTAITPSSLIPAGIPGLTGLFPKAPFLPGMPQIPGFSNLKLPGMPNMNALFAQGNPFSALQMFKQAGLPSTDLTSLASQASQLMTGQQTTTPSDSIAAMLPATIPGAPPEAQAALASVKMLATLAENPKIKKAVKKGWKKIKGVGKKVKKTGKKVKKFFKKLF